MEIQRNEILEILNSETKEFSNILRLVEEYLLEIKKSSKDVLEFIKDNPNVIKICYPVIMAHYGKKFNISYITTKDGRLLYYF